ncbi:Hypothetical protein SCF082_LOCUS32813 [Durusdinium trenchii]|uniref:EF-hand domain-containing protein n=1 Tax=Durusdinium trenchii TaxID=1381693 RepID=A0ABP0NLM6_9DINO
MQPTFSPWRCRTWGIVSLLVWCVSLAEENVLVAEFKQDFLDFDLNKDNQIDAQEVRAQFKGELDAKELHQFFLDVDKDLSGTISMDEYIDYAASLNTAER